MCACVVEGFVDNQLQFSLPDTADFLLNKNCVRILPPFMIMSKGMKVSLGLARRRSMGPRLLATLPPTPGLCSLLPRGET